MFVGTLLTSRMSDKALKHGKIKLISLTCCMMFGAFSSLCSFVESFPLIVVYMALTGLVDGVWWATYPALIVEITSGYHTNEAFGLVNFIVALVRLPGPPFLGMFVTTVAVHRVRALIVLRLKSSLKASLHPQRKCQ